MNLERFIKKRELIDLTRKLIQIPTENPPGKEKEAFLFLKPLLSRMGFRVKSVLSPKGRCNIIAEKRWGKAGRILLFNGHLDVVPPGDPSLWKHPPFQGRVERGRIYGRGASDMKAGIAALLQAVSLIGRSKMQPAQGSLVLHLVSDEESHGHHGTGFLGQKGLIKGDAVLVGEPTGLDPVIAQKGALWFKISTFGRSAHGSSPHLGVNAISKMMKVIERLDSMPIEKKHDLLGKSTINLGTIRGGTKVNVVPDRCEIEVDRRMLPDEKKEEILGEVKEALNSIRSEDSLFEYRIEEIDLAEPSETSSRERIVKIGLDAIEEVNGKRPEVKGFSGFTDARFYVNQYHIPSLILGPGETGQAHTANESVEVDSLIKAAQIYALIIRNFLSSEGPPRL